ncbi:MAG: cytidylate kinase-like family protein [Bacteroidales bacterium]|jgi:hypothetical protein|nr:cytidylate kinase-like family protein [Bacteroidales bacterium]
MNRFSICIGRQVGSGGKLIGEKLSAQLAIPLYDRELIGIAARESGMGKTFFEQADERPRHSFWGGLLGWPSPFAEDWQANYLSSETLFNIQSDVIRKLAAQQSCIFVGRCADYVLASTGHCVAVFICADPADRLQRIMTAQETTEQKAADFIARTDKQRAAYYNFFTGKTWGAAESYHLCINSSLLGIDDAVTRIRDFVETITRG